IIQGDRAMLAGDRELARSWYQRAIKQNPQVAAAHLRMAQVHLAAGELSEADAVLRTALVFAGTDLRLKARLYFLQAVVRERTTEPSAALASWNAFLSFAQTSVGEPQPLPTGGQGHEGSATPAVSDVSPGVSNVEHPPIRSGEAPLYR